MRKLQILRAIVDDRACGAHVVEPLDGEVERVSIVWLLREVPLDGPDRFAPLAERRVQHGERLGEAHVRRPLPDRFFQHRARLAVIVGPHQRIGQPLIDL